MMEECRLRLLAIRLREHGAAVFSGSPGEQGFPHHLAKEGAGIEMVARGEVLEGPWETTAATKVTPGSKIVREKKNPIEWTYRKEL